MRYDTDILILGAGPAGTSAARVCAQLGMDVLLVDRAKFPREKVCGDALIPDALRALRTLDLESSIASRSVSLRELRIFPPRGPIVSLAGNFRCIQRRSFDHLLLQAAVAAGAAPMEGTQARRPILDGTSVIGATVSADGREFDIRARCTLLATGADTAALRAFGFTAIGREDASALRAYFQGDAAIAGEVDYLTISYDASLCPGYGWIFPGPEGTFNIGVGWLSSGRQARRSSLPRLLQNFLAAFPLAARVVSASTSSTAARGAPLRLGLKGPLHGTPGLLVIGEAAGFTFAATGEGIGKAMESGIVAAEIACSELARGTAPSEIAVRYVREVEKRHRARFAAYDVAQRWTSKPWLLNLLARRANAGTFLRRELEALLAETGDPRVLFSVPGLLRTLGR